MQPSRDTSLEAFRSKMFAALEAPALAPNVLSDPTLVEPISSSSRRIAGAVAGLLALGALVGTAESVRQETPAVAIVNVGEVSASGNRLIAPNSVISTNAADVVVSAPASITGPNRTAGCGPLSQAQATERLATNPNAPVQSKAEMLAFYSQPENKAFALNTIEVLENGNGPVLGKMVPKGKTDGMEYFKNAEGRRIEKDVTSINYYCDKEGNVKAWRVETLKAGTDMFAYVIKNGVFTRADGTTVNISKAELANSLTTEQNGETLLLLQKAACLNAETKPKLPEVVVTTKAPETTTTLPAVTTTKAPATTTTLPAATTTTLPPATTTTVPPKMDTTTTTRPPETTTTLPPTTSTTRPPETTTTTTRPPETTTTTTTRPPATTTTLPPTTTTTRPPETTTTTTVPPKTDPNRLPGNTSIPAGRTPGTPDRPGTGPAGQTPDSGGYVPGETRPTAPATTVTTARPTTPTTAAAPRPPAETGNTPPVTNAPVIEKSTSTTALPGARPAKP